MKRRNMNEAEQDFKSRGTITKKFTLPILFWEEFEKDCYDRFNGTYHLKMLHDHQFTKSMTDITQLIAQDLARAQFEIAELRQELDEMKKVEVQEEAPVKEKNLTFG